MADNFSVKLADFEGPLELLLELIERRKLHISRVALAAVADDFVTFLQEHPEQTPGVLADFLFVASTLMLIKSASLLPKLELSENEITDMDELERRLRGYKILVAAAAQLRSLWLVRPIFSRPAIPAQPIFSPPSNLTQIDWPAIIRGLLRAIPATNTLPTAAVRRVINLETAIARLSERIGRALRLNFQQYVGDPKDKANIIVSFLGLLELVRRGAVTATQARQFANIEIETATAPVTPRY